MLFPLVSSITVCKSLLIYESMNIYVLCSFTYFQSFEFWIMVLWTFLYICLDGVFVSLGFRPKSSILDHRVCAWSGQMSSSHLSECLFNSVFSAAAAVYKHCTTSPPCKHAETSIWKCFICWKCNPQCNSVRRWAVFEGLGPYSVSIHTLCWERIEQEGHKYSDLNLGLLWLQTLKELTSVVYNQPDIDILLLEHKEAFFPIFTILVGMHKCLIVMLIAISLT